MSKYFYSDILGEYMADNVVNVKLKLTAEGVAAQQKATKEIADNLERANRAGSMGPAMRSAPAPRSAAQRSAPHTGSEVTEREYGKVRGAVGTGAAGRDFAKQAQGLGGLVALYATFAANIFAVGAAYTALDKAASTERLAKATEMMSISTGIHLKSVSKNLVEASGYALSFSEAMQFTNIGTSAGLASRQIESLTKIAKGAANALGRDVGDSVRRIIQGTAKQEQEILDELGIFVKASQAYAKFSAANQIKVADMTGAQRTQAYANEVERLGEKWNDFAEIPDPFSKFGATGKDALNELLATVNKVFTPLISFLSESKSGVQALIVLITAGLTKRAVPELGNLFKNLFNYDKTMQQAKVAEISKEIQNNIARLTAEIAAGEAKLAKAKKVSGLDAGMLEGIVGGSARTYGKQAEAGISVKKLTNKLLGPDVEKEKFKDISNINKEISQSLKEQLTSKGASATMLDDLVKKDLLVLGSTKEKLILGKEAIRIGEESHKAVLKELQAQETILSTTKSVNVATKERVAEQKRLGNSGSNTPVVASRAAIIAAETASLTSLNAAQVQNNLLNEAALAKVPAQLAATEARIAANAQLQVSAAKGSQDITRAFATEGLFGMKGIGAGLKETALQMSALFKETNALGASQRIVGKDVLAGSVAVRLLGSASIATSGMVKILGLAVTGIGTALGALIMPLTIAWTLWELFGDKIKGWIGIDTAANKRLEESKKKLEDYNEVVALGAMSLKAVNEARLGGINSIEEKIHWDTIELNAFKGHVDAYIKLIQEKKEARDKETLDSLKKEDRPGKVFSEEAFRAKQMAEAANVSIESKKKLLALAEKIQALDNEASKPNSRGQRRGSEIIKAEQEEARKELVDLTSAEVKGMNQRSSQSNIYKSAVDSLSKSLEEQVTVQKKLGAPELGLNSERAKSVYDSLTKVFQSSEPAVLRSVELQRELAKMIAMGGAFAAAASPIFDQLAVAQLSAARRLRSGELANSAAVETEMQAAMERAGALNKDLLGIAKLFNDKPKAPKAIVPYDLASKNLFDALKNDIDETSLKLKQLSGEQAAEAAIESRLTSIRGSTSADAIAATKKLTDKQSELTLTKDMTSAVLDYEKVMKDRSKVGAEGIEARKEAGIALRNKATELNLTKEQADKLSYINNINSLIAKSTADQTTELKKRSEMEALATGYAEQKRAASEADLDYAVERGYLTSKEIVDAQYLLEIEKQKAATRSGLADNSRSFQEAIAPQLAVLSTPGDTEGDLRGKELARAKLIEIEESYTRQNALILSGAEGLAFQTTRAHELKSAIAGSTDNMDKMKNITESLAVVFGDLGSSIGAAGEAILKMAQDEEKHAKAKKSFEEQRDDPNSDMKDRRSAISEISKIEKKEAKDKLSNIGSVAGATKKMFKEHTGAYKVLSAVEKTTHAFKMAMQIKEMAMDAAAFLKKIFFVQAEVPIVAGAVGAKTSLELAGQAATMPAKIAGIYASFMSMLGPFGPPAAALAIAAFIGSFSGGNKGGAMPDNFTSENQQKVQGTGMTWEKGKMVESGAGVFGAASDKSESIVNSLEILSSNSIEGLDYDNRMLKAMERVAAAIGTAAESIYQIPGVRVGSAFGTSEGTSGGSFLGWGSSTSTSIEDSGIKLQGTFAQLADSASMAAKIYENVKTTVAKSSWFGLSKSSSTTFDTQMKDLAADQAKAISEIFVNATSVFVEIGKSAGVTEDTVRSKLSALNIDLAASTRGLTGADLEKELNAVIGSALSAGAKDIFAQFDKFKKFGEDYLQTTIRVVDGNSKVDQALRSMGNTFDVTRDYVTRTKIAFWRFNTTLSKFDISEALIKGAGGLENFMEQASFFTDSFLTDEERLAPVQEAVSERLKDLGLSSTLSRDSFKKLVLAQDLSSEAGRTMYQNLMELAPGFDQVTKGIDDTVKKLGSFEEAIYKLRGDTGKALALARTRELEETDVRLRASQTYVWALEDEVSIKDKLTASINNNISSLKSNIKTLADYSEKLKLGTSSVMTPAQKYAEAKNQLGSVFALASSSPTTDAEKAARNEAVGKLSSASETFLTMSKTMFASSEQYVQDYQSILQMLGTAEADMKGQLTDAEKQLEEVKTSNSYLKSMDESTYSTAQLMQQFLTAASASETARVAAGESGSLAALAIPARANGGPAEGLTWVGENGPELANFTKPAMIYSNGASNDLLNNKELVAEIKLLHREIAQLRKDQQEQTGHLIATNYDANQKAAAQVTKSSESVAATNLWVQRSQPKIA